MDYDLRSLGNRQFEHLSQALALKYIGPHLRVFGSGRDGGREASWDGEVTSQFLPAVSGYGVLQAKYKEHADAVDKNATWLIAQGKAELKLWADPTTNRNTVPDCYILASNVRISAVPGSGSDLVLKQLKDYATELGLEIGTIVIWHYDVLRTMLDDAQDIRRAYQAWITPGDVLARLLEDNNNLSQNLQIGLRAHAAKTLLDDRQLNLTQAGSYSDASTGIAEAFVDLPFTTKSDDFLRAYQIEDLGGLAKAGIAAQVLHSADDAEMYADTVDSELRRLRRTVIVGGPGQGKSTVGQFLCQVYRAAFLRGHATAGEADVASGIAALDAQMMRLGLPMPAARRWPIRIRLTDLADSLADDQTTSVLQFVAQQVSRRCPLEVSTDDMSTWLRTYPWFVVFDGLDEVPVASNRSQVIDSIRDFMVDVAANAADVAVLATTRPQGYSEEFSPASFRHLQLDGLDVATAQLYADRLLTLRLGEDSERKERASSRLRAAFSDEATLRLMNTPLQVTILTLLVERFGQAPRDRWKLFSQYYNVIYQRELEKGGPLAEILESHEADINFIHRSAGYLLQQRGEVAGESASLLTREAFRELIVERLATEGHSSDKASAMAATIESLTTDRLVFLAALQEDRLGFEIRSLQEFMAGEYLVEMGHADMLETLQSVALSSYWRNAFLFAVARIFEDRQHFRGEVTTLCDLLNRSNTPVGEIASGSRVAMLLLADGLARKQPLHQRSLMHSALEIIKLGPCDESMHLSSVCDYDELADAQMMGELHRIVSKEEHSLRLAGAIAALAARREDMTNPAPTDAVLVPAIRRLVKLDPLVAAPQLLTFALEERLSQLLTELQDFAKTRRPHEYLHGLMRQQDTDGLEALSASGAEWQRGMAAIAEHGLAAPHEDSERSLVIAHRPSLKASWRSLTPRIDWATISAPADGHPEWRSIEAIAEFAQDPSEHSLADTLETLASTDPALTSETFARFAPWPLYTCIIDAKITESQSQGRISWAERLSTLSGASRHGRLGTVGDWRLAEARWASTESSDPDQLFRAIGELSEDGEPPFPLSPSLATEGTVLQAATLVITHVGDESAAGNIKNYFDAYVGRVLALPAGSQREELASLVIFLLGAGLRPRPIFAENATVSTYREVSASVISDDRFLALTKLAQGAQWGNSSWLMCLQVEDLAVPGIRDRLIEIGRRPALARLDIDGTLNATMWESWIEDDAAWPLARIALWADSPNPKGIDLAPAIARAQPVEPAHIAFVEVARLLFGNGLADQSTVERLRGGPVRESWSNHDQDQMLNATIEVLLRSPFLLGDSDDAEARYESAIGLSQALPYQAASDILHRVADAVAALPAGRVVDIFRNPARR